MKKIFKWLITAVIIVLLLGGIYISGKYAYNYIILPSYFSVKYTCYNITIEELQEEFGYTLSGVYRPSTDEIILYDTDPKTLKHEQCHAKQKAEGRLDTCEQPIKLFFDEVECYIKMYF